jgi:hypothetical protein
MRRLVFVALVVTICIAEGKAAAGQPYVWQMQTFDSGIVA